MKDLGVSSPITSDGQEAQPRCIYHLENREREENSLPPCWSAREKNTFHLIHKISYFSCHGEGVRAKAFPQLFLISRNVDKYYSMDQVRNICSRNRKISPILQVHHPWENRTQSHKIHSKLNTTQSDNYVLSESLNSRNYFSNQCQTFRWKQSMPLFITSFKIISKFLST